MKSLGTLLKTRGKQRILNEINKKFTAVNIEVLQTKVDRNSEIYQVTYHLLNVKCTQKLSI